MADETPSSFEKAADALRRAMTATNALEQGRLLDEALRHNRRALAQERAKLDEARSPGPSTPEDPTAP